ncbi:hypothetical protein Rctr85_029 [Virus Rctr85]|nr:hypothetical protein Rctr85_029 [Virus Rctr85]
MSAHTSQNATVTRRLSAALLRADKRIVRHEKTANNVSSYVALTLVKGGKAQGLDGYVRAADLSAGENRVRTYWEHASDLRENAVVVKVQILTYGKGELPHPYFANRTRFAEDVVEFWLAMPSLNAADAVVLGKDSDGYFRSDILKDIYGGRANAMLESVVRHIVAAQNMLANGGMDVYDARETVRGDRVTPFGQFCLDNGKRQDKALRDYVSRRPILRDAVTPETA